MSLVITPSRRNLAILMAMMMLLGAFGAMALPAQANHPTGSCLDVSPEQDTNPTGTSHTVTATLRADNTTNPVTPSCPGGATDEPSGAASTTTSSAVVVNFEITGINDPDQSNSTDSPDRTCTIQPNTSSCVMPGYVGQFVGTDTIRGWIAGHDVDADEPRDPAMENRADPLGDEPDSTDVVEKTWVGQTATKLDCEPETSTNSTGDPHKVTCTATNANGGRVGQGTNIDAEASGANDPDGTDGGSPDFTCTTNEQGQCFYIHGPGGTGTTNNAGSTSYRSWIDSDNNNGTDNSTAEPQDAPENDNGTDVVTKTWVHAPLNCFPETDKNPAGTAHTITCIARNAQNQPAAGIFIDMEASGANSVDHTLNTTGDSPGTPDFWCTTDANGQCSMTHGPGGRGTTYDPGTTTYRAWVDEDGNHNTDPPSHGSFEGDLTEGPNSGGESDATAPTPSPSGSPTAQPGTDPEPDRTDVMTKTWTASSLDCTPETDTNPAGTAHTISCKAAGQGPTPVAAPGEEIHIEASGANDPDGTQSLDTPDFICVTDSLGRCSITHGPGGKGTTNDGGTTVYAAWIDFDGPDPADDNTIEADPDEGRAEGSDTSEPDDTDVVEKRWIASRLDCVPESDTNPAQSAHTVTCTATDVGGVGQAGMAIDVEATGANDTDNGNTPTSPDFSCTTGSNGQCSFTHGPGGRGTTSAFGQTQYRAWIDADGNDATTEADVTETRNEGTSPTPGSTPSPSGSPSPTASGSPSSSPTPTSSPSGSPSPSPSTSPGAGAGSRAEPDDTDVVEKNWSAVPTTLRIDPEADSAPVGSCNSFTITALDAQGNPVQSVVVDIEQRHERSDNQTANDEPTVSFCTPGETDGSNPSPVDPTRGDLGTGEDGTIGGEAENQTDKDGKVTIGVRVSGAQGSNGTGNVLVTAFYENEDNDDPDAGDAQDSATKTWTPSLARTIDCEPETAANRVGTRHLVTCTVRDANGDPVSGEGVTFTEDGPGSFVGPTQANTDANGQATATTTSDEAGDQTITGALTSSTEGEPDTDECDKPANDPQGADAGACSDTVAKTWRPGARVKSGPCRGFLEGTRNNRSGGGQVIVGTQGPDELRGTRSNDIICGLGGRDTLIGRRGADLLAGGGGNDVARGGAGRDRLKGNDGKDTLVGAGGNDRLNGGGDDDILRGGAGDDTLKGRGGDDVLRGGDGSDTLLGGGGNDRLNGDAGRDDLDGGPDRDRCAASPPDRLSNCES